MARHDEYVCRYEILFSYFSLPLNIYWLVKAKILAVLLWGLKHVKIKGITIITKRMEAYERDVYWRGKKEKEEMRQKTEKYDRFKTNHVNNYFKF